MEEQSSSATSPDLDMNTTEKPENSPREKSLTGVFPHIVCALCRVQPFVTPRTAALQAPLPVGFSRRDYWSGLPFPFPEDRPKHRYIAAAAKSLQSCPTLCDPIDGSPPGSPVPGIPQARILEWVAISFSNAGK